jgi:hypothetical protein
MLSRHPAHEILSSPLIALMTKNIIEQAGRDSNLSSGDVYSALINHVLLEMIKIFIATFTRRLIPVPEVEATMSPETSSGDQTEFTGQYDGGLQAPSSDCTLPMICVENRYLQDLTEETLAAIQMLNNPPSVFQRTGSLCRLKKVDETKAAIEVIE